jgi:DNA replication protein DnaC
MNQIAKEELPALTRRGVPERTARAATVATETDAVKQANSAAEDLIVLAGHAGVGKSVAACLWLHGQARGQSQCMRWIQSGDLARGFAYDAEAFNDLSGVYALVIDDFGVEYLDERGRFQTTLEELLSRRFAWMRKTLLTTNEVDPEKFTARYGERIASRLNESGAFIVCAGSDLRRVKGAA